MAVDLVSVATWVGVGLGGIAAGFVGGRKGGKEGAANTLNGTADAVRGLVLAVGRLEDGQQRQASSLDRHIVETNDRFTELGDSIGSVREDVAYLKGQQDTPPKKPAARRRPRRS